jgi:hypothetical protein
MLPITTDRERSIEVLLYAVRKRETVTTDLESLAQEIAQFITGSEVEAGATVLVRRGYGVTRGGQLCAM